MGMTVRPAIWPSKPARCCEPRIARMVPTVGRAWLIGRPVAKVARHRVKDAPTARLQAMALRPAMLPLPAVSAPTQKKCGSSASNLKRPPSFIAKCASWKRQARRMKRPRYASNSTKCASSSRLKCRAMRSADQTVPVDQAMKKLPKRVRRCRSFESRFTRPKRPATNPRRTNCASRDTR